MVSSTWNSASSANRAAAAAASPALNAAAKRQSVMAARIAGEEQHRLGRQIAAGGAGRRAQLVVRVQHQRRAAGDARRSCAQAVHFSERTSHSSMFSPMRLAGDGLAVRVQRAHALEFAEDRVDAAGAMHVLHVVVRGRRHLAQARHAARDVVDALDVVGDARLARDGQRVQNGVGRAAHGDVQHDGVVERLERGDVARLEVALRPA